MYPESAAAVKVTESPAQNTSGPETVMFALGTGELILIDFLNNGPQIPFSSRTLILKFTIPVWVLKIFEANSDSIDL